jgi:hypothetical protein
MNGLSRGQRQRTGEPVMQSGNATSGSTFFYDPVGDVEEQRHAIAPRSDTLNGKVIGLLDNTKHFADVLLNDVKELLLKEFPQARFRLFRKQSVSGADTETIRQLALCHAVVTALGD